MLLSILVTRGRRAPVTHSVWQGPRNLQFYLELSEVKAPHVLHAKVSWYPVMKKSGDGKREAGMQEDSETLRFNETERRSAASQGLGEGRMRNENWGDENILELGSGGCTTF